jgi:dihydrofolate reductase
MGKTIMGAVVSLDGFIADDNDEVGPLFDWYGNGDVSWSFPGSEGESRSTQSSADFMRSHYRDMAVVVIGRRLFDLTNGWNGKSAAGEHVFVVTHQPPTDWSTSAPRRSRSSTASRRLLPPPRSSPATATSTWPPVRSGGQALKLGLIDQVVVNLVPVVFGSGRPFFATGRLSEPLRLENPTMIVQGDQSLTWSTTSAAEGDSAHAGAACRRRMQKSPLPQSRSSTEALADARGPRYDVTSGRSKPARIRLSRSGRGPASTSMACGLPPGSHHLALPAVCARTARTIVSQSARSTP